MPNARCAFAACAMGENPRAIKSGITRHFIDWLKKILLSFE
jgi:hypothetical protein